VFLEIKIKLLRRLQRINTKTNKRVRERKRDTTIYTGSSHKSRVVQSPCTSKGFHYNHTRLQVAQAHKQETSFAQVSQYKRLLTAQAHKQETSKQSNIEIQK
jgi:hypothetical protein